MPQCFRLDQRRRDTVNVDELGEKNKRMKPKKKTYEGSFSTWRTYKDGVILLAITAKLVLKVNWKRALQNRIWAIPEMLGSFLVDDVGFFVDPDERSKALTIHSLILSVVLYKSDEIDQEGAKPTSRDYSKRTTLNKRTILRFLFFLFFVLKVFR